VRAGEISQITKDHSLVEQKIEDNLLSRESAENHPYSNIITRSLGPKPAVAIDVNEEPFLLVEGDVFLLCSDGLTKMVPDERILELAQLPQPREAALRLVEEAKKGGGLDNITVLVVRVARLKPQDEITQIKQPGKEKPRRIRFWGR
jgi:protein phosphatase